MRRRSRRRRRPILTRLIVFLGDVPIDVIALLALDRRGLAAATVSAVGAILMFGLAPAMTATRVDVVQILKEEGTTATGSRGPARLRRTLVVAQVALSLALLVIAGLFLQSLSRTLGVDPGFDPKGLVIVGADTGLLPHTSERRAKFAAQFLERASGLAGVTSAAAADVMPLGGVRYGASLRSENGTAAAASLVQASPAYFDTMGLPVIRGRTFTRRSGGRGTDFVLDAPRAGVRFVGMARGADADHEWGDTPPPHARCTRLETTRGC
jgi:putative ABC transport system permease protein